MAVIDIRRAHARGKEAAKAAIERVAEAIAGEYGVEHHWSGDALHFSRSGVKGRIVVAADEVHVHAELGLLASALKPAIEREIERQLDRYVA
ncbi:MAG TPA: polyhydroxyalkanoic acid system family protein [Dokdonella sp.]